jgi:16S rRNA (uracil1498-N3)-methyltransferase
MHLFYYPAITGKSFILDKNESSHCIRVLRLVTNDIIYLTNGCGKLYKAKITKPDKKACETEIIEETDIQKERDYSIVIAIALTKSSERFEWFLEKATEIGIDRIVPLLCENSERRSIKTDRLRKIMISAMKQSLKAWLPEITSLITFEDLLRQPHVGSRFIATMSASREDHLARLYPRGSDILILIGPEGDFSDEEIRQANDNGFISVNLGKSRLRTETAGIVACHAINILNTCP